MKWEIVAHVEEKWTEEFRDFPHPPQSPQTRTYRYKIRCRKRRVLSCTCLPTYQVALNDNTVRLEVTAGCPHLSTLAEGRFEGRGLRESADFTRWSIHFTLTLSKLGHGIFNWRHVAQALE